MIYHSDAAEINNLADKREHQFKMIQYIQNEISRIDVYSSLPAIQLHHVRRTDIIWEWQHLKLYK